MWDYLMLFVNVLYSSDVILLEEDVIVLFVNILKFDCLQVIEDSYGMLIGFQLGNVVYLIYYCNNIIYLFVLFGVIMIVVFVN